MGTIENTDISPRRKCFIDAPHIIVIFFFRCRLLKRCHGNAAGIQICKNMIDRTVFSCRIHRLQYDNKPVCILGIQFFLIYFQLLNHFRKKSALHFFFINIHIPLRRELFQVHFLIFLYTIPVNINFYFFYVFHGILLYEKYLYLYYIPFEPFI